MNQKIDKNSSPRVKVIQKIYGSLMNPGVDIEYPKNQYKKYIKDWGGWRDFLHHKYILSVHGNGPDIDLSWKLASCSVVLMAKPQYSTWFMEEFLIPGHHYVLLKDDYSDLREKFNWCKANQDKCKEIIENAHQYIQGGG